MIYKNKLVYNSLKKMNKKQKIVVTEIVIINAKANKNNKNLN